MASPRPTDSRSALVQRATVLHQQGKKYREIAAELGISVPYANELVRNPDGWRERRQRSPLEAQRDGEVGVTKMARLISEEVGFPVDQERVKWAARHDKIASRRGRRATRYFEISCPGARCRSPCPC